MNSDLLIRRLYNIPDDTSIGYDETSIIALEEKLNIRLPLALRNYYLMLGMHENLNYSYNRLLKPDKEIGFSDDRYLVFYEENQVVAFWGIKEADLKLDDPPVWGNYDTIEKSDWIVEAKSVSDFLLLMAVYNGTFGGLRYNANSFKEVPASIVKQITTSRALVPEISYEKQKVYTNDFHEVISLSFDDNGNCNGAFVGTSDQLRFDDMLDLDIDWSYTSYEDEEDEDE